MDNMPKKGEIRQWKMNFFFFSKIINMTNESKDIFFHYIRASTKVAPDIRGIGVGSI